mmetsp:Transcript_13427/g.44419  ORF Transcript_13427/g.44419 Transcript_13427/m.44419 type:complete len:213 (-) Transcript_13427:262-900(-)
MELEQRVHPRRRRFRGRPWEHHALPEQGVHVRRRDVHLALVTRHRVSRVAFAVHGDGHGATTAGGDLRMYDESGFARARHRVRRDGRYVHVDPVLRGNRSLGVDLFLPLFRKDVPVGESRCERVFPEGRYRVLGVHQHHGINRVESRAGVAPAARAGNRVHVERHENNRRGFKNPDSHSLRRDFHHPDLRRHVTGRRERLNGVLHPGLGAAR